MNLADVERYIVAPALTLLPRRMDSREARAMLYAVGLQESRFEHRDQLDPLNVNGPALGYWQFERMGGTAGVMRHPATAATAAEITRRFDIAWDVNAIWVALEHHDLLACAFARMLLWTVPTRLPGPLDAEEGWRQYVDLTWKPGKPHPETWAGFFDRAWSFV